jgi:hypothetical protein
VRLPHPSAHAIDATTTSAREISLTVSCDRISSNEAVDSLPYLGNERQGSGGRPPSV